MFHGAREDGFVDIRAPDVRDEVDMGRRCRKKWLGPVTGVHQLAKSRRASQEGVSALADVGQDARGQPCRDIPRGYGTDEAVACQTLAVSRAK